jgi:hypothetical protein
MSGSNATPEMSFAPIEGQFADAAGNLEGTAAQTGLSTEINSEQSIASLLDSIFGKKDAFNTQKKGLQISGQGARGNAVNDYVNSLSNASGFDDLMSVFGTASKFVKPIK